MKKIYPLAIALLMIPMSAMAQTASSTASTTPLYLPTQQEDLFIFGLFVYLAAVPFWARLLTVTKGRYDEML